MAKDFGSFFSRIKGRKVSFFGRIWLKFGVQKGHLLFVVQLETTILTVHDLGLFGEFWVGKGSKFCNFRASLVEFLF